jgi:hypothetical protein
VEREVSLEQDMRVGRYVLVRDANGLRHASKPGAVMTLSDGDEFGDETVI